MATNEEQIRSLATESPAYEAAFRALKRRMRNRTVVTVEKLASELPQDSPDAPDAKRQVIRFFRKLEAAGAGKFVVGRRGKKSRFEWASPLREVVALALGTSQNADAEEPDALPADRHERPIAHSIEFPLRDDFTLTLQLPRDLTRREADRLAMFVRSLPMEIGDENG